MVSIPSTDSEGHWSLEGEVMSSESTTIPSEEMPENPYDTIDSPASPLPARGSDTVHLIGPGTELLSGEVMHL